MKEVLGIYCFLGWQILRTYFYADGCDPVNGEKLMVLYRMNAVLEKSFIIFQRKQ